MRSPRQEFQKASLLVALTIFVFGCVNTRHFRGVTIGIVEDSVRLTRTPEAVAFQVTAVLRNDSRHHLLVADCGPQAERKLDDGWDTIFSPICVSDQGRSIPRGDSLTIPVSVFGYTKPNAYPQLDPRMNPGRYRLVFGLGLTPDSTETAARPRFTIRRSPEFVVTEPR